MSINEVGKTRIELCTEQVKDGVKRLPKEVRYLWVDAYYPKKYCVDEVCALEQRLEIVGKLRRDA